MNKRDAAKIRKERLAQIDRAVEARYYSDMPRRDRDALFRERDRQIRLTQQEYDRNIELAARKTTVKRQKSASRFWKHFGQDGRPVPPWEIEAGPQADSDGFDDEDDGDLWSVGEYGYEDFDIDWGGYDYEDTGYADEDA